MNYGTLLKASDAMMVLSAANIGAEDVVGDFVNSSFGGKTYWILQRELYFPPGANSPDGWHLVYLPSDDELALGAPLPDLWDRITSEVGSTISAVSGSIKLVLLVVVGILIYNFSVGAKQWRKKAGG